MSALGGDRLAVGLEPVLADRIRQLALEQVVADGVGLAETHAADAVQPLEHAPGVLVPARQVRRRHRRQAVVVAVVAHRGGAQRVFAQGVLPFLCEERVQRGGWLTSGGCGGGGRGIGRTGGARRPGEGGEDQYGQQAAHG